MSEVTVKPFLFQNIPYGDKNLLLSAMAASWKEGRETLFSGKISAHFKTDGALHNSALAAEKAFRAKPDEGDLIFWKWIYSQGEVLKLYWQGRDYGDMAQVLDFLQSGTAPEFHRLLRLLMKHKLVSIYAKSAGMPEVVIENVKHVEKYYNKENSAYRRKKTGRLLYVILSQEKKFEFDARDFRDVKTFASYLQSFADISKASLRSKVQMLFLDDNNLDPMFEGWLINLGYQHEVSLWNDRFQIVAEGVPGDMDKEEDEPAAETEPESFSVSTDEFETKFVDMLQKYPDILTDGRRFTSMLRDYFPQSQMQVYLIEMLYKMDIAKSIQDAKEIHDVFTMRFIKRLISDFGTREAYAKWAVSVWCVCYGKKVLGKPCTVAISGGNCE